MRRWLNQADLSASVTPANNNNQLSTTAVQDTEHFTSFKHTLKPILTHTAQHVVFWCMDTQTYVQHTAHLYHRLMVHYKMCLHTTSNNSMCVHTKWNDIHCEARYTCTLLNAASTLWHSPHKMGFTPFVTSVTTVSATATHAHAQMSWTTHNTRKLALQAQFVQPKCALTASSEVRTLISLVLEVQCGKCNDFACHIHIHR